MDDLDMNKNDILNVRKVLKSILDMEEKKAPLILSQCLTHEELDRLNIILAKSRLLINFRAKELIEMFIQSHGVTLDKLLEPEIERYFRANNERSRDGSIGLQIADILLSGTIRPIDVAKKMKVLGFSLNNSTVYNIKYFLLDNNLMTIKGEPIPSYEAAILRYKSLKRTPN